jgi:hypothetical protein
MTVILSDMVTNFGPPRPGYWLQKNIIERASARSVARVNRGSLTVFLQMCPSQVCNML